MFRGHEEDDDDDDDDNDDEDDGDDGDATTVMMMMMVMTSVDSFFFNVELFDSCKLKFLVYFVESDSFANKVSQACIEVVKKI